MGAGVNPELAPAVPPQQPNVPDLDRVNTQSYDPETNVATEDVESVEPIGLKTMDFGVRDYFRDIVVPTKDGARPLTVRTAGGDKTILYWKQDLQSGRIALPVMSVNRTGWRFNAERFTPAMNAYFYRRFADADGTRMVLAPREYPLLIDYVLSVWAERKRDIEYINAQVISRFNPIAEWRVEDEFMTGNIIATFEGASDNSDLDMDANQLAKTRYDFNITIEGWLPLPARIVPTVLGKVTSLGETDTRESFGVIKPSPRDI